MLERTDAITNEVLEPFTYVPAYPTVFRPIFLPRYVLKTSCEPEDDLK